MATITDAQAIAFANNQVRRFADALLTVMNTAPTLVANWNNGISALIPNTAAVLVDAASPNGVDGVGGDGRRVITGIDINNLINRAIEMGHYHDNGTLAAGANNAAVYNTVQKPSVNGAPLF